MRSSTRFLALAFCCTLLVGCKSLTEPVYIYVTVSPNINDITTNASPSPELTDPLSISEVPIQTPEPEENIFTGLAVNVTNKINIPENTSAGRYSDRVEFEFQVVNTLDKNIKGIQGILDVQDMFGVNIMYINCDFTGKTMTSGRITIFDDLGIDINQFMDDHTKLYNTKYDSLKFEYEFTQVIFADGSVLK